MRGVRIGIATGIGAALIALLVATQLLAEPEPDATLPDGALYYGPLVDGLLHGSGRLEWPNGGLYQGTFERGQKSGLGLLKRANGNLYRGNFQAGMMHGPGELTTSGGEIYAGTFAQGTIIEGSWTDTLGNQYLGQFHSGLPHGQGQWTDPLGQILAGEFERGQLVSGQLSTSDGWVYRGSFVDGLLTGEGEYTDPDGNHYQGNFAQHLPDGQGTYSNEDGSVYRGNFERGSFSGEGRMEYLNGDIWEGQFRFGHRHGEGRLIPADGGPPVEGIWQWDQLENKEERQARSDRVEVLLYNQMALLEAAFSQLRPSDPNKINLYLLGIGGDGSQEVFRREIEFVSNLFAERFDTQGRSLSLINSRTTHEQIPMATATSVKMALRALTNKMNSEQDILYIFFTSHGSSDHRLMINQQGMQLPAISAERLAELLNETGPKWQVVLVSACYSGGFIQPLIRDTRLIITAADATSRSFGCSDDADMTYFGRAYFIDALAHTSDFIKAFYRAVKLVTEREAESGYSQHSNPQIHAPEAIVEQLNYWLRQQGLEDPACQPIKHRHPKRRSGGC